MFSSNFSVLYFFLWILVHVIAQILNCFFFNTSTCNSQNFKLHCLEFNTLSSITPFLNLAYNSPGLMAFYILMRNELVEVCRVGYFRAPPESSENFRFYVDTNRIQNEMSHLCYKKCILKKFSWMVLDLKWIFLIPNHNLPSRTGFSVQYGAEGHNVPRPPKSLLHRDWTQHIH